MKGGEKMNKAFKVLVVVALLAFGGAAVSGSTASADPGGTTRP